MANMYEIRFHENTQRWSVFKGGEMLYPLRCGDAIIIQVGKHFLPSNVELDTEWFVKFGDSKFWLHRHASYRVRPLF
jgi:hypothetical protein